MGRARPLIMGIVNVTPNSFSDGGKFLAADAAISHARDLIAAGADIIDIGGESTRPGAHRVSADEEWERIGQVVAECAALGAAVSVDTLNASTASRALAAGATYINDVSGGLADPAMHAAIAAEPRGRYILGHWRGTPETMADLAHYRDVIGDVAREIADQLDQAVTAGVRDDQLFVDPGVGFAKNAEHNWRILAHLERFTALGYPVMIGASRKRFLSDLVPHEADGPSERDLATAVLSALLAERGVWALRVHDVAATRVALEIAERLGRGRHA